MLPQQRNEEEIPAETIKVARASFPKGNPYMTLRDEMGVLFTDKVFAALFAGRGRPSIAPGIVALATIMQYMEGLSDRQAAMAVRGRLDWKYALGLPLSDPGFEHDVFLNFRKRLIEQGEEEKLLNQLLQHFNEQGLVKKRGVQRTDATHLLAATREVNRLELVGETLRATLNQVATVAGEWLLSVVEADWFEMYGARVESYRLPEAKNERQALAERIGADGHHLLAALYAAEAAWLWQLPIVQTLRQVWIQQYVIENQQLRWRQAKEQPPAAMLIQTPYDIEARFSRKRQTRWTGYKTHLTESCDPELPALITNVHTTMATVPDCKVVTPIQTSLQQKELLPAVHLVDAGYITAPNLADSESDYQLDLLGPTLPDGSWQARNEAAFDRSCFPIDWQAQQLTCPQGHHNKLWVEQNDSRGNPIIYIRFDKHDCAACPVRERCTRAKDGPRTLRLLPQAQHEALQRARQREKTDDFKRAFQPRAGIEATISYATRSFNLRRCRYLGLAKTHLQNVFTACAVNLSRIAAYWRHIPIARTRTSSFAALALS